MDPKDPKEPEKGEQQPGAPSEKPAGGGRTTPDLWEELVEDPVGNTREGQEGSAAAPALKGGRRLSLSSEGGAASPRVTLERVGAAGQVGGGK